MGTAAAASGPFAVGPVARPWPVPASRRFAGVSALAGNGGGFHAVLAGRHGAQEPVSGNVVWPAELFLFRGADQDEAAARVRELGRMLRTGGPRRLLDLARMVAEDEGPVQMALVAEDLADLAGKLDLAGEFRAAPGVFFAATVTTTPLDEGRHGGRAEPDSPIGAGTHVGGADAVGPDAVGPGAGAKVAFLFPGQGSERPGMLADLLVVFPRLQRLLHSADERCVAAMFPIVGSTGRDAERQRAAIATTSVAQPALGVAGLALHRLLTELGVLPDLVGGHGFGELVALCAAGAVSEAELVTLSAARAEAVRAAERTGPGGPGAMATVAVSPADASIVLAEHPEVVVAAHNTPGQVIVAGPAGAVDDAIKDCAARGYAASRMMVESAFHSPLVGGAVPLLRQALDRCDVREPAVAVWSNASAAPYPRDPAGIRGLAAGQVAARVRFAEQIEAMYESGARIFVEAGPGRVLGRLVGEILSGRPHLVVSCDHPADHGVRRLLLTLAELAVAGVPVDTAPLFAGRDAAVPPAVPARSGPVERFAPVEPPAAAAPSAPVGPSAPTDRERTPEIAPGVHSPAPSSSQPLRGGCAPASPVSADRDEGRFWIVTGHSVRDARGRYLCRTRPLADRPGGDGAGPVTGARGDAGAFAPDGTPRAGEGTVSTKGVSAAVVQTGTSYAFPVEEASSGAAGAVHGSEPEPVRSAVSGGQASTATEREAAVLEYLRTTSEIAAAQREIVMSYLAARAPARSAEPFAAFAKSHFAGAAPAGAPPGWHTDERTARSALAEWTAWTAARLPELDGAVARTSDPASVTVSSTGRSSTRAGSPSGPDSVPPPGLNSVPSSGPGREPPYRPSYRSGTRLEPGDEPPGALQSLVPAQGRPSGDERIGVGEVALPGQTTPDLPVIAPPRRHVIRPRVMEGHVGRAPSLDRFAGRRFALVDDGGGVGLELAGLLEGHGAQVRMLDRPDGPADGLIHLGALRTGHEPILPEAYAGIRGALFAGVRTLILVTGCGGAFGHTTGATGGVGSITGTAVATPAVPAVQAQATPATGLTGPIGPTGSAGADAAGDRADTTAAPVPQPIRGAGVPGLARSIAWEFPDVLVRAIDVDGTDHPRRVAERIFAELLADPRDGAGGHRPPVTLGHDRATRRTLRLMPEAQTGTRRLELGPEGVVLLTGGARGIPARIAIELAGATGCHIEIVGRTPTPVTAGGRRLSGPADARELRRAFVALGGRTPIEIEAAIRRVFAGREVRSTLDRLGAAGASVRYHVTDLRDPERVREVVREVYAAHGRLDGVIHCSGLSEEHVVSGSDPESFARAFETRVKGACALAGAVRPDIGFFVVLGGTAGVLGSPGSAGAAAADDACATLAGHWRSRLHGRVLVADWGAWAGVGRVPASEIREYARRGVALIDPDAAVAALLCEIANGDEPHVVFTGDRG